jgi:hypothetical protein
VVVVKAFGTVSPVGLELILQVAPALGFELLLELEVVM